jgi:hypothetical protein
MYVKRLPGGVNAYGRPSAEDVIQSNKANSMTVERLLNGGTTN